MTERDDCSKSFETILYQSGKFGSYQRRLYAITCVMHIVCSSILTYLKFIPRQILRTECTEVLQAIGNDTILFLDVNETVTYPTTCRTYYENNQGLEDDWVFPEWSFPEFESEVRNLPYYSQAAGLGIGFTVGAILSDYLGRRRVIFSAFGIMCVGQCVTSLSQTWLHFVICQGVAGFGAGGFMLSSMVLVLEYVGHDWRDVCLCLLPWWLGPSLLSVEGYVTRHWRYTALISGMIGLPLLGFYFLILESARWLMCQHKFSEAEQTIKEFIACNTRAVPELTSLFDISRACVLNTMHKKTYTFLDVIRTKKLRRATFAVIFSWFIGAMVYCGLLRRVTHIVKNPYLNNFVLYSADFIVIASAILINKCIGRRWCLFLYAMSSGFISMCILVLHVTNESDVAESMINALGFFTKLGVTTSLTLVNLVTMELYPTVIRTIGSAVGFCSGLAGYLIADQLIVYLIPFHYTIPFIVYGAMMCTLALAVLILPETLYQPLPDILKCRHRNLCSHEAMQLTNGWS